MKHARYIASLLLTILLLPLQACGIAGGPIEGRVLEEGTNNPIEGAIVVVRWSGSTIGFVHSQSICTYVDTATTDAQGRYRIPFWSQSPEPVATGVTPIATAYKPGFIQPLHESPKVIYLKPFVGTRVETLNAIRMAAVTCGSAGESQRNLLPLYQALYEDARDLTVTKADKQVVNALLHKIDLVQLPYDEVLKRDDERNEALRKEFPNE